MVVVVPRLMAAFGVSRGLAGGRVILAPRPMAAFGGSFGAAGGMVALVFMPMAALGVSRGVAGGHAEPGQHAAEETTAGGGLTEAAGQPIKRLRVHAHASCGRDTNGGRREAARRRPRDRIRS
jgi:hypothetical protein